MNIGCIKTQISEFDVLCEDKYKNLIGKWTITLINYDTKEPTLMESETFDTSEECEKWYQQKKIEYEANS